MRDLKSPVWIRLKAGLFLFVALISCALLILDTHSWRVGLLLAIAIWSCCRLYYFAFYVIEHYLDESYRYSGLVSAMRFLLSNRR